MQDDDDILIGFSAFIGAWSVQRIWSLHVVGAKEAPTIACIDCQSIDHLCTMWILNTCKMVLFPLLAALPATSLLTLGRGLRQIGANSSQTRRLATAITPANFLIENAVMPSWYLLEGSWSFMSLLHFSIDDVVFGSSRSSKEWLWEREQNLRIPNSQSSPIWGFHRQEQFEKRGLQWVGADWGGRLTYGLCEQHWSVPHVCRPGRIDMHASSCNF